MISGRLRSSNLPTVWWHRKWIVFHMYSFHSLFRKVTLCVCCALWFGNNKNTFCFWDVITGLGIPHLNYFVSIGANQSHSPPLLGIPGLCLFGLWSPWRSCTTKAASSMAVDFNTIKELCSITCVRNCTPNQAAPDFWARKRYLCVVKLRQNMYKYVNTL